MGGQGRAAAGSAVMCVAVIGGASGVMGQDGARIGGEPVSPGPWVPWAELERINPNLTDVNPMAVDMKVDGSRDLRRPIGFSELYAFTNERGEEMFARRDGAVTAVFPRSTYVRTRRGSVATVPPGTLFIIGEPTESQLRELGLSDGRDDGAGGGGALRATPLRAERLRSEAVALGRAGEGLGEGRVSATDGPGDAGAGGAGVVSGAASARWATVSPERAQATQREMAERVRELIRRAAEAETGGA